MKNVPADRPPAWIPVAAALRGCALALEQLAAAIEDAARVPEQDAVDHDGATWPDVMSTKMAAAYCGYKTSGGLRKAHLDGRIFPAGRRGGVGSWTWARADLDRFMRGERTQRAGEESPVRAPHARRDADGVRATGTANEGIAARSRPASTRQHKVSPAVAAALERIKQIAKGTKT